MDRILLIRHAQAEGHESDDPALSTTGRRQVAALAARLATLRPDLVLHGPRRRARETAELLAEACGVSHEQAELLEDRTPFPSPDRRVDYPPHRWEFLDATPEQERDLDGAAIAQAWQELTERSAGRTLVAITHAFVIGAFVGLALEAPPDAWTRLPIANASITEIQSRPVGQWAVASVSDTGHLLQR